MRRLAPFGLLLALAACTGRTAPLPIRDGLDPDGGRVEPGEAGIDGGFRPDATLPPPPDAGFAPDAGFVDAGFVDAGSGRCEIGPFRTDLAIEPTPQDRRTFSGYARIRATEPTLRFTFQGGPAVEVTTRAPLPDLVREGALVWIDYGIEAPWWTNAALAIREIGPADGPGRLRMLVWSLAPEAEPFDLDDIEVDLEFSPTACEPFDDGCGPAGTLELIYRDRGVELVVGPGREQAAGNVRVGNGRTYFHIDDPQCTDTPRGWFEGYITIR